MLYLMQVNAINAALGRKVAELRKIHGWSQAELADRLGNALGRTMDATAITRLEQGKRPVAVHEVVPLAQMLGVEPVRLMNFGPLDSAIAASRLQADELSLRVEITRIEARQAEIIAELAVYMVRNLESLQKYRETGELDCLIDGLRFLVTRGELVRKDWREILLDAGVDEKSIEAGLKRSGGEVDQSLAKAIGALEKRRMVGNNAVN
jgi:transcriptional regulator with XRE-family HTH domain